MSDAATDHRGGSQPEAEEVEKSLRECLHQEIEALKQEVEKATKFMGPARANALNEVLKKRFASIRRTAHTAQRYHHFNIMGW